MTIVDSEPPPDSILDPILVAGLALISKISIDQGNSVTRGSPRASVTGSSQQASVATFWPSTRMFATGPSKFTIVRTTALVADPVWANDQRMTPVITAMASKDARNLPSWLDWGWVFGSTMARTMLQARALVNSHEPGRVTFANSKRGPRAEW